MNLLHQQCIRLSPDVMARRVGDEVFILNIKSECYFGLDDVGARMFALLTEGASVGETLQQLEMEYDVDPVVLRRDIEGLINELIRQQLIQMVADTKS
jgi:hypothetical protein